MRINVKTHPLWNVIDLDTGEYLKDCFWADDATGEAGIYQRCADTGEFMLNVGRTEILSAVRLGRFGLISPSDQPSDDQSADEPVLLGAAP